MSLEECRPPDECPDEQRERCERLAQSFKDAVEDVEAVSQLRNPEGWPEERLDFLRSLIMRTCESCPQLPIIEVIESKTS